MSVMNYPYYTCNITYMQEEDKVLLKLFGDYAKQIRKSKFISLNDFALNNSLLSSATVSRIENGKNDFKFSTFIKLSNALNMTPAELLENFNFLYSEN